MYLVESILLVYQLLKDIFVPSVETAKSIETQKDDGHLIID